MKCDNDSLFVFVACLYKKNALASECQKRLGDIKINILSKCTYDESLKINLVVLKSTNFVNSQKLRTNNMQKNIKKNKMLLLNHKHWYGLLAVPLGLIYYEDVNFLLFPFCVYLLSVYYPIPFSVKV